MIYSELAKITRAPAQVNKSEASPNAAKAAIAVAGSCRNAKGLAEKDSGHSIGADYRRRLPIASRITASAIGPAQLASCAWL